MDHFILYPQIEEVAGFDFYEMTDEDRDQMADDCADDDGESCYFDHSDDAEAFASCGWGTDEDYGYYGGGDDW